MYDCSCDAVHAYLKYTASRHMLERENILDTSLSHSYEINFHHKRYTKTVPPTVSPPEPVWIPRPKGLPPQLVTAQYGRSRILPLMRTSWLINPCIQFFSICTFVQAPRSYDHYNSSYIYAIQSSTGGAVIVRPTLYCSSTQPRVRHGTAPTVS